MKKRILFLAAAMLAAPPAQAETPEFAARANALCRAIIDARDYQTFKAAEDGSLDLVLAQIKKQGAPSAETANELSHLLQAVNADLQATIEQLRTLPPSPEFDAFLAYGQSRIDINTARIGFLADLDNWQWPLSDTLGDNRYDYQAGMAGLGFAERDCAYVFGSLGNPPDRAGFIETVAPACAIAYDRLVTTDLDQWRERSLSALAAVLQDKPQDPAAIPALRALSSEWKTAYYGFLLVDSKIEEKPPGWEETLEILYQRGRIFRDRADALQYRDADGIRDAFANRIGTPDFGNLGLRETSCMALATLM